MAKTGYEQVGIDEVRKLLRQNGVADEEFLKNSKSVLVEKLIEVLDKDIELVFEQAEEEPDDCLIPATEEEALQILPAYNSPLWSEHVMMQFEENEMIDGAPTCAGCRRVVEQLVGPIVNITIPNSIGPSVNNNGTATVLVQVDVLVTLDEHPLQGEQITITDIADVNNRNCDNPYNQYPSATAMTRAEGRAYRKLLRLRNVVTAEEASERAEVADNGDWVVDEPITNAQISTIDMMCSRLGMSVMDFVNCGTTTYPTIFDIKKSVASVMLKELNKIQRKTKTQPDNIRNYVHGWNTDEREVE